MGSLTEVTSVHQSLPFPNLYVKPVPPGWDEARLFAYFSTFGEVDSVRISNSLPGNRSGTAHAFVRFKDTEGASAAIAGLHGTLIDGVIISIKLADSDMAPKIHSGLCASEWIYVRGLPGHLTREELVALFLQYGSVKSIKHFPSTEYYRGSGALVQYRDENEAIGAIKALNGCLLPGSAQPLLARFADSPAEKAAKAVRKGRLVAHTAGVTGSSQTLSIGEQIQRQLLELNSGNLDIAASSMLPGTSIQVGMPEDGWIADALPKLPGVRGQSTSTNGGSSIYIKGLPEDADKLWLYEKFSRFGGILSVRVLVDEHSGRCNGIGFVNFTNSESACAAHEIMNGVNMGERLLHVMVQSSGNGGNKTRRQPGLDSHFVGVGSLSAAIRPGMSIVSDYNTGMHEAW